MEPQKRLAMPGMHSALVRQTTARHHQTAQGGLRRSDTKRTTENRNKQAQLGLLAGLVLAGDTLEKKHEKKSRDSIESAKWCFLTLLAKAIGQQTEKTKALNDNIISTNQFEPFPEGRGTDRPF
jgi:hypothetical protein